MSGHRLCRGRHAAVGRSAWFNGQVIIVNCISINNLRLNRDVMWGEGEFVPTMIQQVNNLFVPRCWRTIFRQSY